MAFLAQFLGGLAICALVTTGFYRVVRRWMPGVWGAVIASCLSLAVATVIGGFGFSDGGRLQFGYAFQSYLLPQLVVLAVSAFGLWRKSHKSLPQR
jgi:hypothetical protein